MSGGSKESQAPSAAVRRTLLSVILLGALGQIGFIGLRFIIVLDAISLGTSAAAVGLLQATFTLLATVLSLWLGRLLDRHGARGPWIAGLGAMIAAGLLPAVLPGLPGLFIAATVLGAAASLVYVAHVKVIGEVASRGSHMTWVSLSGVIFSGATFTAPLVAGLVIDHAGHRAAYLSIAPALLLAFAVLAIGMRSIPGPHPAHAKGATARSFDLLKDAGLRRVYLLSSVLSLLWESFSLVVPLYGTELGFSATKIGAVLSSLAAAMLVVRVAAPVLGRKFAPWRVLVGALFVSALGYALFPFAKDAAALMALGVLIGLGVGLTQPMTITLLYELAPPERVGAALGLRQMFANAIMLMIPIVFGSLGAAFGMKPVFWTIAASGFAGCWYAKGRQPRRVTGGEISARTPPP